MTTVLLFSSMTTTIIRFFVTATRPSHTFVATVANCTSVTTADIRSFGTTAFNGSCSEAHSDHPGTLRLWMPHWTALLENGFVPDAQHDLETILLHAFNKSNHIQDEGNGNMSLLQRFYHQQLPTEVISEVNKLCKKRAQRIPLQYVIGEWDFRDMTLKMAPPVFIPRPETEMLVELVKKSCCPTTSDDDISFLEVGCGTGAISLSLLRESPKASAVAIDSNLNAVKLTDENSKRYNCHDRLKTYHHCLGTVCPTFLSKRPKFDFIVSNPPYIFSKDMHKLAPEISRYEDHGALDGGSDGMDVLRRIVQLAKYVLKPSGMIWFETDSKHPEMIKDLLWKQPELDVEHLGSFIDFNNRPRFVQLGFKPRR